MDVQAAPAGQVEHGRAQYLPEGSHYDQVWRPILELGYRRRVLEPFGLDHGQAQLEGQVFDRWWGKGPASAGRAVWLGDYTYNGVSSCCQEAQRWQGKLGRTHEDEACAHTPDCSTFRLPVLIPESGEGGR